MESEIEHYKPRYAQITSRNGAFIVYGNLYGKSVSERFEHYYEALACAKQIDMLTV